jgi:hypothetical protein
MVDEDEYRSTYRAINTRRCVFEKAILSGRCTCIHSRRILLADREGIRCESLPELERCTRLLELLRDNARFTLKSLGGTGPLPHTKEIQVQIGGLAGLRDVLDDDLPAKNSPCEITALVKTGESVYGALENLPFQEIMKSIASYTGRRRRPARK